MALIRGKRVDLRIVEKEDVADWEKWIQDPEFRGDFEPFPRQVAQADAEKQFGDSLGTTSDDRNYFILKKDGTKIGIVIHSVQPHIGKCIEIGYIIAPAERGKGYATEAATLLVDYLFLSRNIERIQAVTAVDNLPSQKVVERIGFKREGELRNAYWIRGRWLNFYIWSILRAEWAAPRILASRADESG